MLFLDVSIIALAALLLGLVIAGSAPAAKLVASALILACLVDIFATSRSVAKMRQAIDRMRRDVQDINKVLDQLAGKELERRRAAWDRALGGSR